ncbi:MAG: hypothetical protein RL088_1391 [Verrucomicrobiota bacterium]|jgi:hypothetical protein
MHDFLGFIGGHFWLIFAAMLGIVAFKTLLQFRRHKQSAAKFPPLDSVQVRFHETGVSGSSDKSFWSRFANSGSGLKVTVTDEEIWIRPPRWVAFLNERFDLQHRLALSSVTRAEVVYGITRFLLLEFTLPDGNRRRLKLQMSNPEGFLAALGQRRSSDG